MEGDIAAVVLRQLLALSRKPEGQGTFGLAVTKLLEGGFDHWADFFNIAKVDGFSLIPPLVNYVNSRMNFQGKKSWVAVFGLLKDLFSALRSLRAELFSAGDVENLRAMYRCAAALNPEKGTTISNTCERSCSRLETLLAASPPDWAEFARVISESLAASIFAELLDSLANALRETEEAIAVGEQLLAEKFAGVSEAEAQKLVKPKDALLLLRSKEAKSYRLSLHRCMRQAFHFFGCRRMLSLPGLSFQQSIMSSDLKQESFLLSSRSWMLALLPRFVGCDELAVFFDNFVPLAEAMDRKATIALSEGSAVDVARSKQWKLLRQQLLSTFPSFCNEPLDLREETAKPRFSAFVRELLESRDSAGAACAGVSALARSVRRTGPWPGAQQLLGTFFVRFILARKQAAPEAAAQALLSTIKELSTATSPEFLQTRVDLCHRQIVEAVNVAHRVLHDRAEAPSFPRDVAEYPAMLDVLEELIAGLRPKDVYRLIPALARILRVAVNISSMAPVQRRRRPRPEADLFSSSSQNVEEQAKLLVDALIRRSYRSLKNAVVRQADELLGVQQVPDNFVPLFSTTGDAIVFWALVRSVAAGSRVVALRHRTACIRALLRLWTALKAHGLLSPGPASADLLAAWGAPVDCPAELQCVWTAPPPDLPPADLSVVDFFTDVVKDLLPEILLGLKEDNAQVREESAYLLKFVFRSPVPADKILTWLLPGITAETAKLRSGTVIALAILVRDATNELPEQLESRLRQWTVTLLRDEDKSVFRASLALVRALQGRLSAEQVPGFFAEYLPIVCKSTHCLRFRQTIRWIVAKAIVKTGGASEEQPTALETVCPPGYHGLLIYVARLVRRSQRKKAPRKRQTAGAKRQAADLLPTGRDSRDLRDSSDSEDDVLDAAGEEDGPKVKDADGPQPELGVILDSIMKEDDAELSDDNDAGPRVRARGGSRVRARSVGRAEMRLVEDENDSSLLDLTKGSAGAAVYTTPSKQQQPSGKKKRRRIA